MTDAELKKYIERLEIQIEGLSLTVADQQTLIWELIAQQITFGTVMREVLAEKGQDKTMLRLKLESAYRKAKEVVKDRQQLWQKSSDARPPLDIPPILPDEADN